MREIEESGKEIVKRGGDRKERGKMIEKRGYRKTSGHNKILRYKLLKY